MDALDDVCMETWRNAREAAADRLKAKRGRPTKDTLPKDTAAAYIKKLKDGPWQGSFQSDTEPTDKSGMDRQNRSTAVSCIYAERSTAAGLL